MAMTALDLFWVSPERMEGARAFAEKRPADFGPCVDWHRSGSCPGSSRGAPNHRDPGLSRDNFLSAGIPTDYGFNDDEVALRTELRVWAGKVLASHYQPDDESGVFRRQPVLDLATVGLTSLRTRRNTEDRRPPRWWRGSPRSSRSSDTPTILNPC